MKEVFYFSHDYTARTDPKIMQMRSVYDGQGYGWYWMIIEMLYEEPTHKLNMQGKYVWNAFALQMNATAENIEAFLKDCICEFKLFESDNEYFWSNSVNRRVQERENRSEKARESANARWNSNKSMQPQSKGNANASKSDAIKEKKRKEIKEKNIYTPEFEEFYKSYPNPQDKQRTFKNWKTCLKSRTVLELMKSMENYKEYTKGRERQYIKSSANFLGKDETYKDYLMENYKGGSNGTNKQLNGENKQTPKFDRTKFLAPGTF